MSLLFLGAAPAADSWLLFPTQVAVKATVLLALAGAVALLLRRAPAATRHLAWTLSIAGLVALPLVAAALPAWRVPVLPTAPRWTAPGVLPPAYAAAPAAAESPAPAETPASMSAADAAGTVAPSVQAPRSWTETPSPAPAAPASLLPASVEIGRWLLAIWLAGALIVLGRLAIGLLALRRIAARAEAVVDEEWLFLFDELSYETRMRRPVRLLKSAAATMPMTWGAARPVILLPADADTWDEERRRVVLLHEMAHVRRLDSLTQTLAQVACALYWFHPGAWWAAARMRAERERACDDLVLRAGARASAYAGHLIEVARRFGAMRATGAAAVAMARPSQLEGRVLAVLDEKRPRGVFSRRAAGVAAAGVAALVLLLAALVPVSRDASAASRAWKAGLRDAETAREHAREDMLRQRMNGEDAPESLEEYAERTAAADTPNARVTAALAERLQDSEVEVRRAAAAALAEQEDPRALAALLAALRGDADAEVRKYAAHALGEIKDRRAVEALVAALRDRDEEVRETAAHALYEIRDPGAAAALGAVLSGDPSAEVRKVAAMALAEMGGASAVPGLVTALRDRDPEVSQAAAHALGEIGDPRAVDALRTAVRGGGPAEVRKTAIHALAEIGDARAVADVTPALSDPDAEVRKLAVYAIAEMDPDQAPQALVDLATREADAEVRKTAIWALAELRDPRAGPAIEAGLRHANAEVRKTALYALVELDLEASTNFLIEMTRDPDPEVRKAALHAIGERH